MSSSTNLFVVTNDKSPWKIIRVVETYVLQLIKQDIESRSTDKHPLNFRNDREMSEQPRSIIDKNGCAHTMFKYQGELRKIHLAFFCDHDIRNIAELKGKGKIILSMGDNEMGRAIITGLVSPLSMFGDVWRRESDANNEPYRLVERLNQLPNNEFTGEQLSLFEPQVRLMTDNKLHLIAESPGFFNESFTIAVIDDGVPIALIIEYRQALFDAWRNKEPIHSLSQSEIAETIDLAISNNDEKDFSLH